MITENHQTPPSSLATRLLLACGVIGPLLFIVVMLIEGATRPGYSAWHNFASDLSLSAQGWMQIANFLQCGALLLGFAFGLRQVLPSGKGARLGPLLVGLFGLSLIVAGVFVTDPSLGYYPPGSPIDTSTLHGTIHGANAPVAFGSLTLAIFVFARRFWSETKWRGWGWYSLVSGILLIGFFIACLVSAILDQKGALPNSPTGLLERLAIIIGWMWLALLALRLLRQSRSSVSSAPAASAADAPGQAPR